MISLRQIEKPSQFTNIQHIDILWFLWWLISDNDSIKEAESMFEYTDDNFKYKVLDIWYAKSFNKKHTIAVRLKTKAMAQYLIWWEATIRLLWTGKFIKELHNTSDKYNDILIKHYLYPFFVDKHTISDNILYMWFDILKNIKIQEMESWELNMFIGNKPMDMFRTIDWLFSFEYYLDFSRDKLLEHEVKLWYTSKIIWDKDRWYWYTHMLRANAAEHGKIMSSSAIRLIMWWSWFNMYLTSRKQGKTSFAADRVVAELLSEKWGYGRKNRKIKFFTDNAKKIWWEVMDFIEEFIWDLKYKEIRPGLSYFDISKTNQEVTCNLTWNKFSVVSLKWLEWNSDNSTGDWLACDCAIIDEWFRIIWRFWKSFKQRARDESDWILFISTLNEETEIEHWGYNELIKWEAWCLEEYNTVRSSHFDNSITYHLNYKERGKSIKNFYDNSWNNFKEDMADTSEAYVMKRLLCWILSDQTLFNITWRITALNDKANVKDLRVIWIDMWWLEDQLWVCVFNAKTLIVEEWYSHKIDSYKESIELAQEFKDKFPNCIIVADRWWPVWEASFLLEQWKNVIDYWIKNTGNSKWVNLKEWYYTVNKWTLVLSGSYALSNICKVMTKCNDLIKQFWDMEMKQSSRWKTILYKWKKWRKDDAVFAYLLVFWLLRIIMQLLSEEDIKDFASEYNDSEVIWFDDDDEYYTVWWMTY